MYVMMHEMHVEELDGVNSSKQFVEFSGFMHELMGYNKLCCVIIGSN